MQLDNRILLEVIAIPWLEILVALSIGLLIGGGAILFYYRMGYAKSVKELDAKKTQQAEEAKALLVESQKQGEQRKRELLLEAKEEIRNSKLELDKDAREKRSELSRERSRLDQREGLIDRKLEQQEQIGQKLEKRLLDAEASAERAQAYEQEQAVRLEEISGLTQDEAKFHVLEVAKKDYRHDMGVMLRQMEEEAKESAEAKAKDIIVNAIQRYSAEYVAETTVSVVNLPNDEMKGRIIGREGRNIRALETITGVDVIIDDTPEAVVLSCFDPIRRETARMTMEKLIQDGRIHPARIEEMHQKATRELDARIKEEGEKASFDSGVLGLSPEIIKMLGRLKYRTSYGQNALYHSMEVSALTGIMATELGFDVTIAKRAGLLHDIGKAIDFEQEGTHIELGANLARKYKEGPEVLNAIMSHHGDTEATSAISVLVAAADALSAARPGARRENMETYIKRIQRLEEIANSQEGVDKSYAIQAGREIRVMVTPDRVSDAEMAVIARDICRQIEEELSYPGQIKVNVIRETRFTDVAR